MIKPTFILGSPRSGTTLLLNLMTAHRDFAWITDAMHDEPEKLSLAYFKRIYDLPFVGDYLFQNKMRIRGVFRQRIARLLPAPVEPMHFWGHYLRNFSWERKASSPARRHRAGDVTPAEIEKTLAVCSTICRYQGKTHFLSKYTDFSRMVYFLQVFPNAKFIHIVRDGRASALSFAEKMYNNEWNVWNERKWWALGWPDDWQEAWHEGEKNPLSFSLYFWKHFVNEIRDEAQYLPEDQYLEVRYSDLCSDTERVLHTIFEFCGVNPGRYRSDFVNGRARNKDPKRLSQLSPKDKAMIHHIVVESDLLDLFEGEREYT